MQIVTPIVKNTQHKVADKQTTLAREIILLLISFPFCGLILPHHRIYSVCWNSQAGNIILKRAVIFRLFGLSPFLCVEIASMLKYSTIPFSLNNS